ncbi:MAG: hypothetical protein R2748_16205 [Bryobacterales bacterium]
MLSHYPFIVKNFRAYFGNLWRCKVMGSSVVTPYSAVFTRPTSATWIAATPEEP